MTQPIRGKVARVLNEREIAINKGSSDGVDVGMYFDVMDAGELDIVDPDTEEVLGSIERPKVRVKVTHVQTKLSVASTYRSKQVNLGGSGVILDPALGFGPIARALMPPNWVKKYETLEKTNKTQASLEEKDSKVKTGDPIVQVIEKDEAEQENPAEK